MVEIKTVQISHKKPMAADYFFIPDGTMAGKPVFFEAEIQIWLHELHKVFNRVGSGIQDGTVESYPVYFDQDHLLCEAKDPRRESFYDMSIITFGLKPCEHLCRPVPMRGAIIAGTFYDSPNHPLEIFKQRCEVALGLLYTPPFDYPIEQCVWTDTGLDRWRERFRDDTRAKVMIEMQLEVYTKKYGIDQLQVLRHMPW